MTDITGDGRADIVGFADDGVWVSHEQPDGSFSGPEHVLAAFGFEAGGWQVDRHPRFVADTTGDGRADIVGFADDGVWISRAQPDGSFGAPEFVVAGFGFAAEAGGGRSIAIRASWPTPPVTAAPTSSASATTASGSHAPSRTAATPSRPSLLPASAMPMRRGAGAWSVTRA